MMVYNLEEEEEKERRGFYEQDLGLLEPCSLHRLHPPVLCQHQAV